MFFKNASHNPVATFDQWWLNTWGPRLTFMIDAKTLVECDGMPVWFDILTGPADLPEVSFILKLGDGKSFVSAVFDGTINTWTDSEHDCIMVRFSLRDVLHHRLKPGEEPPEEPVSRDSAVPPAEYPRLT